MKLDKLRGILAEKRITQAELAHAMGLSTRTINLKLNGKVPINVDEASQITKILGVENPIDIFFADNVA